MKNTILFLLFCFSVFFDFAQNIKTETEYLYLINTQKNIEIIKDNLRNAEIVADKIILYPDSFNAEGSRFFRQLAISYLLAEQNEKALYSVARQICFFPDNNSAFSQSILKQSCEKISINDDKKIYERLLTPLSNKYLVLFKAMISSKIRNIDNLLLRDIGFYKKKTNTLPDWLEQYEFYTKIGILPKYKFNMISFTDKSENFIFFHENLSIKQKRILMVKSTDYFIGIKNKEKTKKCLSEYKNIKKGFFYTVLYGLYKVNYLFL